MGKKPQIVFNHEKIHILDARILSFNVGVRESEPFFFSPEEIEGLSFKIDSEESFNFEEKIVQVLLDVTIDANIKSVGGDIKELKSFGQFRMGFAILVDNFSELVNRLDDKEELKVDGVLMSHCFAIAYSTARGMILVKTRGTSLENCILPIIDPMSLAKKSDE